MTEGSFSYQPCGSDRERVRASESDSHRGREGGRGEGGRRGGREDGRESERERA